MDEVWLKFVGVSLGLVVFGLLYNWLVGYMERPGVWRGTTAMQVAVGVAVTVGVAASAFWWMQMAGWQWALLMLGAFASSGMPMMLGYWARQAARRQRDEQAVLDMAMEVLRHDKTKFDWVCDASGSDAGDEC